LPNVLKSPIVTIDQLLIDNCGTKEQALCFSTCRTRGVFQPTQCCVAACGVLCCSLHSMYNLIRGKAHFKYIYTVLSAGTLLTNISDNVNGKQTTKSLDIKINRCFTLALVVMSLE